MKENENKESWLKGYSAKIKGQSFEELAKEQDQGYAKINKLIIAEDALRVEQGEYIVTEKSNPIGTHNLQQCVAIYVRGKYVHGLAHVDGHVEVSSLESFFNQFDQSEKLEVKLFGAHSKDIMGLNDSGKNLNKVKKCLESYQHLFTEDVERIIESRNTTYQNPIFYSNGTVDSAIARGFSEEEGAELRALHSMQGVRRHNRYQGTYKIIEGNNLLPKPVYLDEVALLQLKSYKANPEQDYELRWEESRFFPSTSYDYDKAVPYILETWQNEVLRLSNIKPSFDINSDTLFRLIESTPLHIGHDCKEKNQLIEKALTETNNLQDLQSKLFSISTESRITTIEQALSIAVKYDPTIDQAKFIKNLTAQYNQDHEFHLTEKQIRNKQYGGEITISDFLTCLEGHSEELRSWMVLNSQGGYYIDSSTEEPTSYKISDAKRALDTLGFDSSIADEIVQRRNSAKSIEIEANERGKFNKEDLEKALDNACEKITNKKKGLIKTLLKNLLKDFKEKDVDLTNFLESIDKHSNLHVKNSADVLRKEVNEYLQERINTKKHSLISEHSNYCLMQNEVVSRLPYNKLFNDLTISYEIGQEMSNNGRQLGVENQILGGVHNIASNLALNATIDIEKNVSTNHSYILGISNTSQDEQEPEHTIVSNLPSLNDVVNQAALGLILWDIGKNIFTGVSSFISRNFGEVASIAQVGASRNHIDQYLKQTEKSLDNYNNSLTNNYRQIVDSLNTLYDKKKELTISDPERLTEESLKQKYQIIKRLYDKAFELEWKIGELKEEYDRYWKGNTKIRTSYMRDMNLAINQLRESEKKLKNEYQQFRENEMPIPIVRSDIFLTTVNDLIMRNNDGQRDIESVYVYKQERPERLWIDRVKEHTSQSTRSK